MALTISKGGQIVAQGSSLKLIDPRGGRGRVRGSGSGCVRGLHCANERSRVRGLVCVDPAGEKMHRRSVVGCEWDSCVGEDRRSLCVLPIKICDQLFVSVPQVEFLKTFSKALRLGEVESLV